MSHVDDGELTAYADGAYPAHDPEALRIGAHLSTCENCRARLELGLPQKRHDDCGSGDNQDGADEDCNWPREAGDPVACQGAEKPIERQSDRDEAQERSDEEAHERDGVNNPRPTSLSAAVSATGTGRARRPRRRSPPLAVTA